MARVRTVCVGSVRTVVDRGREIPTGIYKLPVKGPVRVAGVNLEGDNQADRTVHGGPHKAVYAFPSEHYPTWAAEFPALELRDGAFGENLTTEGLLESQVRIGDLFQCGSSRLRVTQPRMPCPKLALRLGEKGSLRHMLKTKQTGFYFAIEQEGELQAGDRLDLVEPGESDLVISDVTMVYSSKSPSRTDLVRLRDNNWLPADWRIWAERRLG